MHKPSLIRLRRVLPVALALLSPVLVAAPSFRSVPFNARSGSGGQMTFTAIPAIESGLVANNPYEDPAMWGAKYAEFQGGAIGSGVAIGDLDGDGLPEVFIACKTAPNRLYRQVAPFRFEDITATAGVAGPVAANGVGWKTGVTMADIDNDGDLDLYVCRFNAPNLLFLNDGKGRFTEAAAQAGLALVSGSVVGAFEDYDRDGQLDLFVVTNVLDSERAPDGEPDYLFRNRGDGTFEEVTLPAGIGRGPGRGHSATWFDANDDGWADLYIANDFSVPDYLYQNNGDGTFTDVLATAVAHTTWFSMGSDSADINNDGLADLLVAEMAGTTHYKSKVAMGDMGGVVDYMDTLVTPQYMKNAVFLNSGADRFYEAAKMTGLGSTDWSWSARFEDLDNDGWVDLHVTNGMVRPFIDSDLLNRIKKLNSQREIIALMKAQPPQRDTNLAYRNDGNLRFTKVQKDWGLDHAAVSFGSAFADLDNDGDLDLVYVNYDELVSVYRNDSPGGNSVVFELRGQTSNSRGVGARIVARTAQGVQTRRLSVARGALSSSEPILHFGLGASTSIPEVEIRWPSGHVQKLTNVAANARYVVTEPSGKAAPAASVRSRPTDRGLFRDETSARGLDYVNLERVFNDMKRPAQSLLPNRMNTLGGGIAVGDVNGDKAPDLFFAGGAGNGCGLYLNDGKGSFTRSRQQQPWDDTIEREAMAAVFVDLDRDGDLDLVVSSGGVEADKGTDLLRSRAYLNNGYGKFSLVDAEHFPAPATSSGVVSAGDFDGDGDLDLFIGGRVVPGEYPSTPESLLLENREGTLVDITDTAAPGLRQCGMVTSALWTDADGDDLADLLVAGEWMSPRLFHNNGDSTFSETTETAGFADETGWWNSLVAADVNNDGAIDYIAGNQGLNSKYHANREHPTGIYYGDFENNGRWEIVETEFEGDKHYPVRGRSCSSRAMPSLKTKFPTFHEFGAALLPEIYPEEKLKEAIRLTATQLASGVFLNDGQGHFAFRPFPRMAQLSPIFGLAAADFDGDGHVDVVAGQNFHGPQVETGRYDGGLGVLMLGDGKGNFRLLTPQESGVYIPGEARAIAIADLNTDGSPDLVVTRINENVLALVNHRGNGHRSVAVALHGGKSNPAAVGAKALARYRDGSVRVAEVHAGSGYLTQADPCLFFGSTAANPLESVDVTWPGGAKTSHKVATKLTRLDLSPN